MSHTRRPRRFVYATARCPECRRTFRSCMSPSYLRRHVRLREYPPLTCVPCLQAARTGQGRNPELEAC